MRKTITSNGELHNICHANMQREYDQIYYQDPDYNPTPSSSGTTIIINQSSSYSNSSESTKRTGEKYPVESKKIEDSPNSNKMNTDKGYDTTRFLYDIFKLTKQFLAK